MVLGLNNLNMLGLNNTSFDNCSNFNILGSMGNMLTGSIFGMNNYSPFINCNGSYNFNKMAGFAVGGALLNVGMTALNHYLSSREPQHNPTERELKSDYKNTRKEFNAKLDELGAKDLSEAETKVNNAVANAQKNFDNATLTKNNVDKQIEDAKKNIESLTIKIDKITLPAQNDPTYANTLDKLNKLKEDRADLQTKISTDGEYIKAQAEAEKKLNEAKKALEAEKVKETKLNELKQLARELESAEADVIEKVGQKADGYKWTRNQKLNVKNFQEANITEFDKRDINQLVFQFCNLEDGSEEKLLYAKALANLKSDDFLDIATDRQRQVRDFAKKYVEKHSNQ